MNEVRASGAGQAGAQVIDDLVPTGDSYEVSGRILQMCANSAFYHIHFRCKIMLQVLTKK